MDHNSKGFTLIELLVVISIIGVLSSVVIVSVQAARTKGVNVSILQGMQQLRNEFELNRLPTGTYPDFAPTTVVTASTIAVNSFTNTKIQVIIAQILSKNNGLYGGGIIDVLPVCQAGDPYYGVHAYTSPNPQTGLSVSYPSNGLSVYVELTPPYNSCGLVAKYAIYAEKSPIYKGGTITDPLNYSGYYCLDSSGNSINANSGWIPGAISDGKCH